MDVADFTVVVPFDGCGDPHRDAALEFVVAWIGALGYPVVVERAEPGEPWSKGAVVDRAVQRTETAGLIISDGDVVVHHHAIATCASAVVSGWAWAYPHDLVYRLSPRVTLDVLAHRTKGPSHFLGGGSLERRPHAAPRGGGLVVLSRDAYDAVGGIDPRFYGWGGEDISFGRALDTLAGPAYTLREPMWHLYHEPQEIRPGRRASEESERLASRYLDAVGNADAMREVVTR